MKIRLLFFLFLPISLFAQDTTKLKTNITFSYLYASGNIDRVLLVSRMDLVYGKKTEFTFSPSWTYGTKTSRKTVSENEILYNISLHFKGNGRGKIMIFHDFEKSNLRKISIRSDIGIGVGFKIYTGRGFNIDLSEALLGEVLNLNSPRWVELRSLRLSTRVKVKYNGKFNVSFIGFIQPAVHQDLPIISLRDNIILRSLFTIDHPIGKSLNIGLTWNFVHQGFVPMVDPTLKSWDSNTQISFRWGFVK